MIKTHKTTGRASSIPGGLGCGGVTSLAVTLLLSAAVAKSVESGMMKEGNIGYAVMGILLAASYLGAEIAQVKVKHRRALVCVLSGAVYYCILLGITALFFGGQYTAMGVTALVVLAGSATAALTSCRREGKRRHRNPKRVKPLYGREG